MDSPDNNQITQITAKPKLLYFILYVILSLFNRISRFILLSCPFHHWPKTKIQMCLKSIYCFIRLPGKWYAVHSPRQNSCVLSVAHWIQSVLHLETGMRLMWHCQAVKVWSFHGLCLMTKWKGIKTTSTQYLLSECCQRVTILCFIPRTTVTSLGAPKEIRCKTHPLGVNPGILFWTREITHMLRARY